MRWRLAKKEVHKPGKPIALRSFQWRLVNTMVPKFFGRKVHCLWCHGEMVSMMHLFDGCPISTKYLNNSLRMGNKEATTLDRILGPENHGETGTRENIRFGSHQLALWRAYWDQHFQRMPPGWNQQSIEQNAARQERAWILAELAEPP